MKKWKERLYKTPLWLQSAIIFTTVVTLVITSLIAHNYIYNRSSVLSTSSEHTRRVLQLEMDKLNQYIKDLTAFAIQPCYDARFSRAIESKFVLTDSDLDYLKEQMRAYYYSRSDLNSYKLSFLTHRVSIGRTRNDQRMKVFKTQDFNDYDRMALNECRNSKYYLSIMPTADPKQTFFTFYHSIIKVSTRDTVALVKADISRNFLKSLLKSYEPEEGEFLVLYNTDGMPLYSGRPDFDGNDPLLASKEFATGSQKVHINGISYFATATTDRQYGLKLVSLKPYSIINADLNKMFITFFLQGLFLWVIAIFIMFRLSRMIMKPLRTLADNLTNVGEGELDTTIDIHGSSEIDNLGNAFNFMSSHIKRLINENYLTTLSEQSARLTALEAQINPHFLYNTLQAISTEALVNEQPQIHEMVTALASIFRYSIKGGDLVTLADEVEHVRKYIYLQKNRMEDNLSCNITIAEDANPCLIPKISLQTLVENSIIHGMGGNVTSITIDVHAFLVKERLHIDVRDNGIGISEEQLQELHILLSREDIASTTEGVGLANLKGRLKILFGTDATLEIESKEGNGTHISMSLPVKRQ